MTIFYKLAENKNYYPEQGDRPYKMKTPMNELTIGECYTGVNNFLFVLYEYNNEGEILRSYYIDIDDDEMEEALMKLTAKKYNL